MDTCLNIERFKQNLIHTINSSQLTVGCALYVLKDAYNELYLAYKEGMLQEQNGESFHTEKEEYNLIETQEVTENDEQNND